jgi:hypothetical protein
LPVPTCRLVVTTELLVFYPSETRPKKRHFDGPVSLGVKQAVGENPELVPGFTSISREGVIYSCVAYCDREAKQTSSPMNAWASALWHLALNAKAMNAVYAAKTGP